MSDNKFITLDGLKTYNNKIQEQIEAKNTEQDAVIATKFDKAGGAVTGSLTLPNSPTTPDEYSSTAAYTSRITANGEYEVVNGSTTLVTEIKGSTVSCKNLIPYPYDCGSSGSQDGIDYTVNADGSITLNGTPTTSHTVIWLRYDTNPIELEVGKAYRNNGSGIAGVHLAVQANDYSHSISTDGSVATYPEYMVYITIYSGTTINNATIYPMLYEGTEEKPYQPYFTGIKHAYIDSIKSTGHNFVPPPPYNYPEGTYAGITYKVNSDGSVTANGTATSTSFFVLALGVYLPEGDYYISDSVNMGFAAHMRWGNDHYNSAMHSSGETRGIEIRVDAGTVLNNVTFKPMINRGSTALPYEPYTEEIYQLPQTLELGEFDSFNPQTGELVKGTGEIVLDDQIASSQWDRNEYDGNIYFALYRSDFRDCKAVNTKFPYNNYYEGLPCLYVMDEALFVFPNADKDNPTITTVEEWEAQIAEWKSAGNPLTVAYKSATPTTETIANAPKSYTVYNGGTETIVGNSNDVYGAMPNISQVYSIHENSTEAANKAYVNNGLAKKLDKTGGTITGNLIVEGKTDTELGAIVSKRNNTTYGLSYDGNVYKLGQGSVNENGSFTFDEGEGLPITLRDDSADFIDGHIVQWSEDGNKLVDSNLSVDELKNLAANGGVKYLGTVTNLTALSTTCNKGDFYRVETAFGFGTEKAHVGDVLIAVKDNPSQSILDWDLIHTEIDQDTWVANSATASGYVAKGEGQANKAWMTDANGTPAWRDVTINGLTATVAELNKVNEKSYLTPRYQIASNDNNNHFYKLLTIKPTSSQQYSDLYYEFDIVARSNIYSTIRLYITTAADNKYISTVNITYEGNLSDHIQAYKYRDTTTLEDTIELWGIVSSWNVWSIYPKTLQSAPYLSLEWNFTESSALPTNATETINVNQQSWKGNAATATTASKLGASTIGSSSQPIYLSSGTATKVSAVGIEYGGTGATSVSGARTNLNVYSKSEVDDALNGKQPQQATSFESYPDYIGVRTPTRTPTQYYEFWDSGDSGWADIKAKGFYTNNGGKFNGDLTGNAASATKATQDGNGNVITDTYAPISTIPTKTSDLTNDRGYLSAFFTGGNATAMASVPKASKDTWGAVKVYKDADGYLHIWTE